MSQRRLRPLIQCALLGTVLLSATAVAEEQLAHQAFRIVISKYGESCTSIAKTAPIGTGSGGDALVAVQCSNGGKHVVRIHKDNSVSYMTPCAELKARTGLHCFAGKS